MNDGPFTVFIVDDEPRVLAALSRLVAQAGYLSQTFSSGRDFLSDHNPLVAGCVLLDLVMPDLDGLELQRLLSAGHIERPIIFIPGHGDIPTTVRAMKAGAIDFLTKPIDDRDLLAAIERARKAESRGPQARSEIGLIAAKLATLTPRERQVIPYALAGKLNKQIAIEFGAVEKTIKVHRARMMRKLGVRTAQDLVRLAERADIEPCETA